MKRIVLSLILLMSVYGVVFADEGWIDGHTGGEVSDDAYSASWNGEAYTAPSQNAVYDIVNSITHDPVTITCPDANVTAGQAITFADTGIMTITESADTITFDATEVDGSTTNEIQSLFETITVATQDNVVADTSTDTLTFVGAGITAITTTASSDTITITSTEVDGSVSNEINTITADDAGTTSGLAITLAGGGINATTRAGDTITVTGTEVDGSTTNEINTITCPDAEVTAGLGITFAQSGSIAITEAADTITFTVTETDALITAGDALTRTLNDIDFDGGATPGGSLGGTWASPTIDDLFIKLGGDVVSAGTYDFGSASVVLEVPNAAAPTTDATGEMAIDTNLITQGMLQVYLTSAIANVVATTDTPGDNEVPTYDLAGGTIQWEAGGGAEADTLATVTGRGATTATDLILNGQIILQTDKYVVCDTFTAAGINAAIDALGAEGGEVYLPEGTYVCTDAVIRIDYANTTLNGSGYGTILDWSAGQDTTTGCIDTNDLDYLQIKNLRIVGAGGGGDTEDLIGDNDDADYLLLENVWLINADDKAIHTAGSYIKIINTVISGSGSYAATFTGSNVTVDKCEIISCGYGIGTSAAGYTKITNSNFYNTDYSIQSSGEKNIITGNFFSGGTPQISGVGYYGSVCSNNTLTGSTGNALVIDNIDNIVTGNTIYNTATGYSDIYSSGNYGVISNNRCIGSGTSDKGIHLDNADYCLVYGNETSGHDVAGIQEDADCQGNLIKNNNLQDTVRSLISGTLHEELDEPVSLADGTGIYTLRNAKAGWGHIYASDDASYAYFTFTTGGVVTLVSQNNCTTTADNDTTLNIYDSGTAVVIENELGATYKIRFDINYID